MKQLRDDGATVVFISHNIPAVRTFCSRVLMMDHGRLLAQGKPDEIVNAYERVEMANYHRTAQQDVGVSVATLDSGASSGELTGPPRIVDLRVLDAGGRPVPAVAFGAAMTVRYNFIVPTHIDQPRFRVLIRRVADGVVCVARSHGFEGKYVLHGRGHIEGKFEDSKLTPGKYTIQAYLYEHDGHQLVTSSEQLPLLITGWEEDLSDGVFKPEVNWTLEVA